jgi:sterol desaturase/sphingolipid hydroxylase (fatty acid hydroxylase superfamily)
MPPELALTIKKFLPALLLALLWWWESRHPFIPQRDRLRHAGRNLALALTNHIVLAVSVGLATSAVAVWTEQRQSGLLFAAGLPPAVHFLAALLLLDFWMYLWHRANHRVPVLWRFHRMHHSDPAMDVTTATRFHLGEHLLSSALRLALVPLAGWTPWHLVAYDTLVIAATQFHHANISLGRWDRILRWLIVTPDMHKMHHSNHQPETDSNYSTVFSVWDRLGRSFTMRENVAAIVFGLREFTAAECQSLRGLWMTPFRKAPPAANKTAASSDSPPPDHSRQL